MNVLDHSTGMYQDHSACILAYWDAVGRRPGGGVWGTKFRGKRGGCGATGPPIKKKEADD